MKKNTHPSYQQILFIDSASGHKFVIGSTLQPQGKEVFEGKEYPVYYLSTSSSSHPFFTKEKRFADAAGRIEKFNQRFAGGKKAAPVAEEPAAVAAKPKAEAPAAKKPAAEPAKTAKAPAAKKKK